MHDITNTKQTLRKYLMSRRGHDFLFVVVDRFCYAPELLQCSSEGDARSRGQICLLCKPKWDLLYGYLVWGCLPPGLNMAYPLGSLSKVHGLMALLTAPSM